MAAMSQELPIRRIEQQVLEAARNCPRLVIQAPTGSGKSTQIPQILLDGGMAGSGQIVVLQPRRLPARMLAARVAYERKCKLGTEVGYQVRFDDCSTQETRIKFITEGLLLRLLHTNPDLKGISIVVFDEFHERHLATDISLAAVKAIQQNKRPDLKVVAMSATLDAQLLAAYLAPCEVITSESRLHPVEISYSGKPPEGTMVWDAAADALETAVQQGAPGDALLFMPGVHEIRRTIQAIGERRALRDWIALPLYGELPPHEQDAAVAQFEKRKAVVATNVAETSLTIDGVRIVIDSGIARIARFDPHRGINTLWIEPISHSSAQQRAGRAGRTEPGVCIRLWSDKETRHAVDLPEIHRADLAESLLTLSGLDHCEDTFPWVEPPDPARLKQASEFLADVGARNPSDRRITPLGRQMLSFPAHPRISRMMLAAEQFGCVRAACTIAALVQERSIFVRTKEKSVRENREDLFGNESGSDFFVMMRALQYAEKRQYHLGDCRKLGIHAQAARQVAMARDQFLCLVESKKLKLEETPPHSDSISRCILAAYADRIGASMDGGTLRYQLVHQRRGQLDPDSCVSQARLIAAAEIAEVQTQDAMNVRLSLATAIEEKWLREQFPEDFHETDELAFDPSARRVMRVSSVRFRDLSLSEKLSPAPPSPEASAILARAILPHKLVLKHWDHDFEQTLLRIRQLGHWCPELNLPTIDETFLELLRMELCESATSDKEIKDREVLPALRKFLDGSQWNALEKFAPAKLELPSGRKGKIRYVDNAVPILSARIQDLYGVEQDVPIAKGRVIPRLEILAPNFKPVQITSNLSTFWKETYPAIKSELSRKYPKHEWR